MATPGGEVKEEVAVTAERRVWVRFASDQEAVCRTPGPRTEIGWAARVRDISRGGAGLLLRHRFRPGTELLIELRDRKGEACRVMAARVIHARVISEEGQPYWLMGCAFDAELTKEELETLM